VIDHFFVPGKSDRGRTHGEFGFDFYQGRVLDWAYASDLFSQLDVAVYYPVRPNRDGRGFVIILKGYEALSLSLLNDLPLVRIDKNDPIHRDPVRLSPLAYFDLRHLARAAIPLPWLRAGVRLLQKLPRT
jgi:hypothetical protein